MKKILFFLLIIFISTALFAKDFQITDKGKSTATIIIPKEANTSEIYAANELKKYIKLISNTDIIITSELVEGNKIFVGEYKNLKSYISGINTLKITSDTVIIKTKNDKLILTGGSRNGVIYSVYTFLEDYLGVKYILPEEDYIPNNSSIQTPQIDYLYTPPFMSRDTYYYNSSFQKISSFCLKHKQNGFGSYIDLHLGDKVIIVGYVHTLDNLMNPEVYGKDHPHWFALRNGKRLLNKGQTQPCFSNKEMIKELTKNLFKTIKENPNNIIFSVSQSDNDNYCECDKCQALAEKYNQSGLLLLAINEIADSVKEKYPNILIETLAYHYTQLPPKGNIKPRNNVIIRYCPYSNQRAPITDKCNEVTYSEIEGWSKIAKNIFIYDYSGDFYNYLLPFPNTQIFQENMKLWVKMKALGMLNLGDFNNTNTWFLPYKNYILCKLSWNPNINIREESKTFMNLYYGPGGDIMYKYLLWNEGIMSTKDINLHRRYETINYYTIPEIIKSYEYLNRALELTKNNEKYYNRIWCDYICFSAGVLGLKGNIKKQIPKEIMQIKSFRDLDKELIEFGTKHGITYESEGKKIIDYTVNDHKLPKPEICKNLTDNEWFEINPEDIKNSSNSEEISKVVNDSKAPCGKARWMNYYNNWHTQINLHPIFLNENVKYIDVYATYRLDENEAYTIGVYSHSQKENYGTNKLENTKKGEYSTKKLFTLDYPNISPDSILFVIGSGKKELSKGLYIDRIFFVYRY